MQEVKKISAVISLNSDNFTKNLTTLNTQLKATESEIKRTDNAVKIYGQNTESLAKVQSAVTDKIEALKKKVELYDQQIQKSTSQLNKNEQELKQLADAKEKLNKKYEESVRLAGTESKETQELAAELKSVTKAYEKKESEVQKNINVVNRHSAELNKTAQELDTTENKLQALNKELKESESKFTLAGKGMDEYKTKLNDIGSKMDSFGTGLLKLSAPFVAVAGASIKVSADFEAAMSNVQAISGATGDDLKKLEEKAKEMGAATSKSATESADALGYMALAGWDVEQMTAGLEPVLRLAEAGNLDLARASDLVTDSMSALGLEVSDLNPFLDMVAQTSASANTNVDALMEAFLIAGGKAASLGVDLNELSTTLGVMANRGLKGAEAGRGLSAILTNLTSPAGQAQKALDQLGFTAFDSEGNFIGLENTFRNLARATKDMTQEQQNQIFSQIAGKEHAKTLSAIMAGLAGEYEGLKTKINNADGALGKMAETMQANTKGNITRLKSQLEGLGIQLGEALLPHLNKFIETISKVVQWFSELSPATQEAILKFGLFAGAAGGVLKVGGGLVSSFGNIVGAIGKLIPGITGLTGGLTAAAGSGGGLLGAIAPLAGKLVALLPTIGPVALAIGGIAVAGKAVYDSLQQEVIPSVDLFADKVTMQVESVGALGSVITQTTTSISEGTKNAVGSYLELDKQFQDTLMSLSYGYEETNRINQEALDAMSAGYFEIASEFSKAGGLMNDDAIAEFDTALNEVNLITGEGLDKVVDLYAQAYFNVQEVTDEHRMQIVEMWGLQNTELSSTTMALSQELLETFDQMGQQINSRLEEHRQQDLASLEGFLTQSKLITEAEYADMVAQTEASYESKKRTVDETQKQISEILNRAKEEHRALTQEEVQTIQGLQQQMKDNAVRILAQNEVEANIILERMKAHDTRVTAEQAQQHIQNLNEQRDGAVAAAEEEYEKTLAAIIRMRDETGVISEEQATKMIEEATRQKDETIKAAEETRERAVDTIFSMNEELEGNVNRTTGEIMSWWDKLKGWWSSWQPEPKEFTVTKTERTVVEREEKSVKANALGTSYYQGGLTTINERGFELIDLPRGTKIYNHEASERYLEKAVEKLYRKVFEGQQQGEQTINIYSPTPLNAYEVSKQLKNTMRELAMVGRKK